MLGSFIFSWWRSCFSAPHQFGPCRSCFGMDCSAVSWCWPWHLASLARIGTTISFRLFWGCRTWRATYFEQRLSWWHPPLCEGYAICLLKRHRNLSHDQRLIGSRIFGKWGSNISQCFSYRRPVEPLFGCSTPSLSCLRSCSRGCRSLGRRPHTRHCECVLWFRSLTRRPNWYTSIAWFFCRQLLRLWNFESGGNRPNWLLFHVLQELLCTQFRFLQTTTGLLIPWVVFWKH